MAVRPVIVGVCGGVAAGKNLFTRSLLSRLRSRGRSVEEVDMITANTIKDNQMDCYVMRGMTLFTDQPRNFFDLKIFLDVDADIRLTRILSTATTFDEMRRILTRYQSLTRPYHIQAVLKQRPLADICFNGSFQEKDVDSTSLRILQLMKNGKNKIEEEPDDDDYTRSL
ncbi:hypothetical protein PRIPAC_76173 [Pristionchus pacificus]|uniref:Uncharacterized protein n=1 Tax=Pristionchus pacificus TaxID=54126 RepID=A0A2A6CG87_PRIPA|nr:hypothetical protein PRIPAC_76173 [Pristionchus pacificus]|eukprot:PDM77097.1 hypothetical protein PRIPAC_43009 [Pristionchus pacificus]